MATSGFARRVATAASFNVLVEFTCPAGEAPSRLLAFLDTYRGTQPHWEGVELTGVTVTQSPSGAVTAAPNDVLALVHAAGGLNGLEFVPHVSAKGMNLAEIEVTLKGLLSQGVADCFVVTGDRPSGAMPVFEADALNVLQLIRRMNADALLDAGPERPAPRLWAGVAVGLAKYEEATCIQQLIKLEKKIRAGAGFVITNLLFDPRKAEDFFRYLRDEELEVPVFGNVFFLHEPAARRMLDEKLPGVYVSPDLYEKVRNESYEQHVLRAARQVAMWRDLGAAGVDLGNVEDLGLTRRILDLAIEIGPDWRKAEAELSFPPSMEDPFYLYTENGTRTPLRVPSVPGRRRIMDWVHDRFFEEDARGYRVARKLFASSDSLVRGEGFLYEAAVLMEEVGKGTVAKCRNCGDCFLPENFNVCVMGECAKGLPNVPCGDSTVDGHCGPEPSKICAGKLIYDACRFFHDDLSPLLEQVNPPRNPALRNTSSLRNFYLGLDHRRRPPLILVAELLHSSLPKVRRAIELAQGEPDGFRSGSAAGDYLRGVIEAQALRSPDFIDINIDDAGQGDVERAGCLMKELVGMVCGAGSGIPPCIDSSDPDVIKAGLQEYYRLRPGRPVLPLVNSVNRERADLAWELREIGPCNLVYMVVGGALGGGSGEAASPESLEAEALDFFRQAVARGYSPGQLFFDTTVVPLAMEFTRFDGPGFNYVNLEGLRRIMSNREMSGVNSILGITNLVRDFPQGRKVGLLRAYLQIAMDAGLTAAIVDVRQEFGIRPPEDQEILDIVRTFTGQDGTPGAYERMNEAYTKYRSYGIRKPSART